MCEKLEMILYAILLIIKFLHFLDFVNEMFLIMREKLKIHKLPYNQADSKTFDSLV